MQDKKTERYKLHPNAYDRSLYRDLVDLDLTGLQRKYVNAFYKNGNVKEDAPLPLGAWVYLRTEDDDEVCKNILVRKQYGNVQQSRLRHILCQLELAARDKFDEAASLPDDLTVEHVLPDTWMDHWPLPDGTKVHADLKAGMTESQLRLIEARESLKHTLGNLTLLTGARNPSLGNLSFDTKRDALRHCSS